MRPKTYDNQGLFRDIDIEIGSIVNYCISEHLQHSMQVQALADQIHLSLPSCYVYNDSQSLILHTAAGLHDIGWKFGKQDHHINSMAMILVCDFPGVSSGIKRLIALAARYHRKRLPKESDEIYNKLDSEYRNVLHITAGILRIADALDNSHSSNVISIKSEMPDRNTLNIHCQFRDNPQSELDAVNKKADLLEQFCKIKTNIMF